ncbi:MAG TPA: cupredoxin domain-containing protein [Vicinamibacterales bacterium]|nr:cupredoxin domain-containing protein [Vicinamibacterales bacterium]
MRLLRGTAGTARFALALLLLPGLTVPRAAPNHPVTRTARAAQDEAPAERRFTIIARRCAFDPSRIEVTQGDLVRVLLKSEDIPHSFTIDAYRIAKRVSPGHPVTFEFQADKAGTFTYYCNLTMSEGCRKMQGELVVKARP